MSILITGMEMPVDCLNCKFCNTDFVEPYCRLLMRKMQIGERPKYCPLIEVPEPHGRCIDADLFTKDECNNCDGACKALPCDCLNCKADCRCDFMQDIANAPTVIPASEDGE